MHIDRRATLRLLRQAGYLAATAIPFALGLLVGLLMRVVWLVIEVGIFVLGALIAGFTIGVGRNTQ